MKRLLKKYNNMKYRYKLTNLLVLVSLVPMTVLALYSHSRMSSLVRKNEMEDMYSILEQTRENIDGQIEIYASLLNYLTYSPEIQEVIFNKDMDRYTAYEQYTEVVDPLLTDDISAVAHQLCADDLRRGASRAHGYGIHHLPDIRRQHDCTYRAGAADS